MAARLTILILTLNEERNIARCLASAGWAEEVLVVDSYSTDATESIVTSFGARWVQNRFEGYAKQYAFGVAHAANDWVLILDADEEISSTLRSEIENLFASPPPQFGFEITRRNYFLGRWIGHGGWYPDYQFRLFHRRHVYLEDLEVHGGYNTKEPRGRLNGEIFHYSYPTLFHYLKTINAYTSLHVSTKLKEQPGKKIRARHLVLNPLSTFLRAFISLKGYRDGVQGLILALFSAIYTLVLYAKRWEYQRAKQAGDDLPPVTHSDFQQHRH